jgi:hypothetical protein
MRYRTSDGNSGFVGRHGDDLYAGRDGNVYRRTDNGWQNFDNGKWNSVDRGDLNRPTQNRDSINSLDRQRSQRSTGNQRYSGSQSFSRGRSSMSRGGGGMRGGGGRR